MTVSRGKIEKKDLVTLGLHSIYAQSLFSFERMQAPGFTASMIPAFKKIYGDNTEEIAGAMMNNMSFINTEPHAITFLQGLIISLEEAGEDRDLILNIRTGLFGPLAGLGDAVFWFTLLPISAAIAVSFSQQGSVLGPIIYMTIWAIAAFSRIWFGQLGYKLGVSSIDTIRENGAAITKAAGLLGVMVVGGLIPSYVSFSFSEELLLFNTVGVQSIFDSILPNILPLGLVVFMYYLFREKKIPVITVIVGLIVFSVLMSFLGIL